MSHYWVQKVDEFAACNSTLDNVFDEISARLLGRGLQVTFNERFEATDYFDRYERRHWMQYVLDAVQHLLKYGYYSYVFKRSRAREKGGRPLLYPVVQSQDDYEVSYYENECRIMGTKDKKAVLIMYQRPMQDGRLTSRAAKALPVYEHFKSSMQHDACMLDQQVRPLGTVELSKGPTGEQQSILGMGNAEYGPIAAPTGLTEDVASVSVVRVDIDEEGPLPIISGLPDRYVYRRVPGSDPRPDYVARQQYASVSLYDAMGLAELSPYFKASGGLHVSSVEKSKRSKLDAAVSPLANIVQRSLDECALYYSAYWRRYLKKRRFTATVVLQPTLQKHDLPSVQDLLTFEALQREVSRLYHLSPDDIDHESWVRRRDGSAGPGAKPAADEPAGSGDA